MTRTTIQIALSLALLTLTIQPSPAEEPISRGPVPRQVAPLPRVANRVFWTPQENMPDAPTPLAAEQATDFSSSPSITLEELQSLALARNPTLVQAAMQVRAAQGRLLQAGLYPNPIAGYQAEEMGDEGTAGQQGAFVGQKFVLGGKLRLDQAVAQHEIHAARHAHWMQEQRVLNEVASAFCETLAAQQIVDLDEKLLALSNEGVEVAERLLAAMEVARIDVLQAQIEADNTRMQRHEDQNRLEASWRRLAAVAAIPQMSRMRLDGRLDENRPEIEWQQAVARLLDESPQLAIARERVRQARCRVQRECAERTPDVEAEVAVRYNNATQDNIASVGIGIPIQIFDRNQGNINRAQADLISAQREVCRLELLLQSQLAASFEEYSNNRAQSDSYRENILPRAEESLRLVQTSYRQGQVGYLTLLTAQRTYFQSSLQYLRSLRDLRLAAIAVDGLLLQGGLERPEPARQE